MSCPHCEKALAAVAAQGGYINHLERVIQNSRSSLAAQGKSLRRSRRQADEALKNLETQPCNTTL